MNPRRSGAARGRGAIAALLAVLLHLAAGCAGTTSSAPATGRLVVDTITSALLAGNPLGDSPHRQLLVYLPAAHRGGTDRLPSLYLLHGFDGTAEQWTGERFSIVAALDSLFAAGEIRPMVVIMPDGRNRLGGSFFADAAATGAWGRFVTEELVPHVDRRYRTIASRDARGVAGWSMGGRAALDLATRPGSRFGAVYAMSPCCLGPALLDDVPVESTHAEEIAAIAHLRDAEGLGFHARLVAAAAAASAPAHAERILPYRRGASGQVEHDFEAIGRWMEWRPAALVGGREPELRSLRAIGIDAGRQDGFPHIPLTVRELTDALTEVGVPHRFELYEGTHGSEVGRRLREVVLPFFSAALEREEPVR